MKFNVENLAKVILDSVNIREDSFDHAAADERNKILELERKNNPDNPYIGIGEDWNIYYRKTMEDAIKEACRKNNVDEKLWRLVDLSLSGWWNDVIWWAEDILGIARKEEKDNV